MDSQKRLLLALALSFGLTLVYMMVFPPAPSPGAPDAGTPVAAAVDGGGTVPQAAAAPPAPVEGTPDGGAAQAQAVAEPPPPVQSFERSFPLVHYRVDTRGASLTRAELQGTKMREQEQTSLAQGYRRLLGGEVPIPPQMDMALPAAGQPQPLAFGVSSAQNPLAQDTVYRFDEAESSEKKLVFRARSPGWEVTKTLEWPHETALELRVTLALTNRSPQATQGELAAHWARAIDPHREEAPSFFGSVGNQSRAACALTEKLHTLLPGASPPDEPISGPVQFFGIDQQYFLAALFPEEGARPGRCELLATDTVRAVTAFFPLQVAAGETVTFRFGGYVGPKDLELLKAVPGVAGVGPDGTLGKGGLRASAGTPPGTVRPGLERTVDFGIWAVLCNALLWLMKKFHDLLGSWGVAVVLLTVVVKLLLVPLTHKSMVAAEAMKKLQPKMEELRKKFANDRERQNLEMMKLYQEAKVNPLGGCLPILLQMPVWIALFTTLRNSYELYREPFMGSFLTDLTYKDPTYLLPVLLGVTMVVTQKLQPAMMDPTQAKIMTWFMPIFFTVIMLNYPGGLTLYILTNNILSIIQTYLLRKWLERGGGAGGATPALVGRKA